jgi:putative YhbY family RNA-binding protein
MDPLLPTFRRELRARAHHLHPVVSVGHHRLTPAVFHEIDIALTAHELIKVRLGSDDRDERVAMSARICAELHCAAVQQIGKLLVLWRPRPAQATAPIEPTRARRGGAVRNVKGVEPRSPARPQAGLPRRRARVPAPETRAVKTRWKAPAGNAPLGVPRAALPRRRRRRAM